MPGVFDMTPPEVGPETVPPGSLSGRGGPSEESLAREMVAIHGQNWRHDYCRATDLYFTGTHWQADESSLLLHVVGGHLREACDGKPAMERASVARGVMAYFRAHPSIAAPHELTATQYLLPT